MPIEVQCSQCSSKFRVTDKFAGKRVKCPKCQGAIVVPDAATPSAGQPAAKQPAAVSKPSAGAQPAAAKGAAGTKPATGARPATATKAATGAKPAASQAAAAKASAAKTAAKEPASAETASKSAAKRQAAPKKPTTPSPAEWYLQTEEGEQYGPVTKEEMDGWVTEGRIDASCQLLCEGWDQWKWAEEVYSQLSESPAAPPSAPVPDEEDPIAELLGGAGAVAAVPGAIDLGINLYEDEAETRETVAEEAPSKPEAEEEAASDGAITAAMKTAMQQTRPWVALLSIVWFALGGVAALVLLALMVLTAPGGLVIGLPVLAIIGLYLYVAFLLFNYAKQIDRFVRHPGAGQLEKALEVQKNYWKLNGIITLAAIGLGILTILLAVVAIMAFGMALGGKP